MEGLFNMNISLQNKSFIHPIYALPHLQHFFIIGLDFLRKHGIHVGGKQDRIIFLPESEQIILRTYQLPSLDQKENSSTFSVLNIRGP